jgi:ParB family chromosome partitioning protein
MTKPRQTITHIKAELLTAHPDNIRDDLGDLGDLARSIIEHGILQPITVTEHRLGGFLILAGHRRFAAGRQAGLTSFPAIIRHDLTDHAEQLVVMLVENVQRRDLSPVEKAEALGALRHRGVTPAEISRRTGIHASTVSSLLALLDLDEESRQNVRAGHLNAGDAIAAVREVRRAQRIRMGGPTRGRPVIAEPAHFNTHPLLPLVSSICGHTTRPKVGNTMCCGQCWEAVIRADATGQTMPEPTYDEAVVQRICAGDTSVHACPCDRVEVVRRWIEQGKPVNELARRTGWKVERYYTPEGRQEAAS